MPLKQSNLLEGLNEEQKNAVTHKDGPLLIIAGAGTGKTTVVTRRIAWLIEQGLAKPGEILALTFTEKAATEMEERVDKILPYGYLDLWISTFHSFGQRILESHALEIGLPSNFHLLTTTELWVMIRQNLEKFDLDYYRPLGNPSRFIHTLIKHFSRAKDELITPQSYVDYAKGLSLNNDSDLKITDSDEAAEAAKILEVANAFAVYQKLLVDNNALDFGDLINYSCSLFRERPAILNRYRRQFKYVLVDEFQDTNYAQFELVKQLCAPANNITVVGDDDQSIYKFRGASVSNILKFQEIYKNCEKITLTNNYRSCQNLLDLSYKFIQANNPERLEVKLGISKKLRAARKGKGEIQLFKAPDYYAEAEAVVGKIVALKEKHADATWNDFAILVRANDSADVFTEILDRLSLPYIHLSRRGLYKKTIILDALSYFRLLDNYHESRAMYRVLNLPKFAFSNEDVAKILDYTHRKTCSIYEALKHPEFLLSLTPAGQESTRNLFALIEKHTLLARSKPVNELYVQVVSDLGLSRSDSEVSPSQAQDMDLLDQFNRRVKDFAVGSEHRLLKDFMEEIELELAAGEQGSLDFDPDVGPEAIKIITVHSAKGLEFRFVFLPAMADKKFPAIGRSEPMELPEKLVKDILPSGDFHIQEERRLFYVAMTRARDGLYFSYALDYGGSSVRKPSVFIKDLGLVELESKGPTGRVSFAPVVAKKAKTSFSLPKSFSFTSISAFRSCSLDYKFTRILKVPQPGGAALSFGQTMHKALENYLKEFVALNQSVQGDLFKKERKAKNELPTGAKFLKYYEQAWVDDWYEDKFQKNKYREQGREMVKDLYSHFQKNLPVAKYLEKSFKLGLEDKVLVGKIDRADETPKGLVIIDYKTGGDRALDKVDKEQLLIYQWAAEDFLREKVAGLQYWYLRGGLKIKDFLGTREQIDEVKVGLLKTIEQIIDAVKNDAFEKYHKKHKDCKYSTFE